MTEPTRLALIGSAAAIIVSIIAFGGFQIINDSGIGMVVVNRLTGAAWYCSDSECTSLPFR